VCVRPNECIRPEVLAACEGKLDSDTCQTPEGAMGICGDGVCIADTCGDGRVSFGEVCDGDDLGDFTCETFGFHKPEGLACAPDCGFDASGCGGICGDSVANGRELCDGSDLKGATRANDDVWVFGDGGAVSRYNGTAWSTPTPTLPSYYEGDVELTNGKHLFKPGNW
jgi:hypothetical protein